MTLVIRGSKYSHKSKRITKKETEDGRMRVVSCQRLRISSVLCDARMEAKHWRDSATVRGIESSSTDISIHAYYIRRASRKCIQRSRNLHPWRVRDASWSIYLAEAPRPVLCFSFSPRTTLVTSLPSFLLVACSATCILLSRWYLV